ncbi:unnamed protein product [Soboliphyme baturini]|uniref:Uncharacterized protein n=1 Tax=Soboliphyme baturini TaxID=241478 RepID=A0A183IRY4_9BILA|nr:unnamed protein product [Soboliphyme baturini]
MHDRLFAARSRSDSDLGLAVVYSVLQVFLTPRLKKQLCLRFQNLRCSNFVLKAIRKRSTVRLRFILNTVVSFKLQVSYRPPPNLSDSFDRHALRNGGS